jgi:replication fork clamp-binding protein CrfC
VTDQVCGKSKQIIDKPIVLNIFSKSCPTLTIIDLPGITSIPVGEQPANIYDITKNMALRYITEKRSIILCVIPANQDLSTSEALKILREIDPSGERSIGCLTKVDIMNRGDDARKMLKNEDVPLRYGYVGIKNRCQEDINNNVSVEDSLKAEKKYFTTSPIYSSLPADLFGTDSLTKKLTNILYNQIKTSMPEIFE